MKLIVDNGFDPLIVFDKELRVVAANRPARDLLGSNLIGATFETYFSDEDLTDMICCIRDARTCSPEVQFSLDQRVFRARADECIHDGQMYISLALQDVTQLLRLNRARREMVANISHELRNPISTIRLLHETLSRTKTKKKQRRSILRKIGRQLDALQRIVEDMHDLSMIESGQTIMRLVATPLLPLLEDAIEHQDVQVQRRKIDVKVKVPNDLFVLVDDAQIRRVLINLIDNAVKFTPKKGTILLHAEPAPNNDELVLVRVCDSGPGIPRAEWDRIFERFYQLDQARRIGRGSGLGLSITKHIIEAHNGSIWVEDSYLLGGTCISFTLVNATPERNGNSSESWQRRG